MRSLKNSKLTPSPIFAKKLQRKGDQVTLSSDKDNHVVG